MSVSLQFHAAGSYHKVPMQSPIHFFQLNGKSHTGLSKIALKYTFLSPNLRRSVKVISSVIFASWMSTIWISDLVVPEMSPKSCIYVSLCLWPLVSPKSGLYVISSLFYSMSPKYGVYITIVWGQCPRSPVPVFNWFGDRPQTIALSLKYCNHNCFCPQSPVNIYIYIWGVSRQLSQRAAPEP